MICMCARVGNQLLFLSHVVRVLFSFLRYSCGQEKLGVSDLTGKIDRNDSTEATSQMALQKTHNIYKKTYMHQKSKYLGTSRAKQTKWAADRKGAAVASGILLVQQTSKVIVDHKAVHSQITTYWLE